MTINDFNFIVNGAERAKIVSMSELETLYDGPISKIAENLGGYNIEDFDFDGNSVILYVTDDN